MSKTETTEDDQASAQEIVMMIVVCLIAAGMAVGWVNFVEYAGAHHLLSPWL